MNIRARDIDFDGRRIVLQIESTVSGKNQARLKRFLGHCRDNGMSEAVLCGAGADGPSLQDTALEQLKQQCRIRIKIYSGTDAAGIISGSSSGWKWHCKKCRHLLKAAV